MAHQPQRVYASAQVIIYDSLLPDDLFLELNAARKDFAFAPAPIIPSGRRDREVLPLRGSVFHYHAPLSSAAGDPQNYPTEGIIDRFIEHLLAILPDAAALIGRADIDWFSFTITPWMFPAGARFPLHTDGSSSYTGGFIYFSHDTWRIDWGGHLLVFDPATPITPLPDDASVQERVRYARNSMSGKEDESYAWSPGIALCILPKPNRLIFLASDALHTVTKIDPAAGSTKRSTFVGFFSRRKP